MATSTFFHTIRAFAQPNFTFHLYHLPLPPPRTPARTTIFLEPLRAGGQTRCSSTRLWTKAVLACPTMTPGAALQVCSRSVLAGI